MSLIDIVIFQTITSDSLVVVKKRFGRTYFLRLMWVKVKYEVGTMSKDNALNFVLV
jgi:hypothetical protein